MCRRSWQHVIDVAVDHPPRLALSRRKVPCFLSVPWYVDHDSIQLNALLQLRRRSCIYYRLCWLRAAIVNYDDVNTARIQFPFLNLTLQHETVAIERDAQCHLAETQAT